MFAEAGQYLERGDFAPAIEILGRAQRLDPANHRLALDLGYTHALAYDFGEAERWFEKAIQLAPNKTAVLMAIADHWSDVRHFDAASRAFEQVLEQPVVPVGALYGLVKLYARQRHLDKAAEVAARAIHLHGGHEAAMLARAKVCRETGQLDEAEKMLRLVLAKSDCKGEARATAFYELAGVLDQQKRYDEAMAALLDAKALLRTGAAPAAKVLRMKQAGMKDIQARISAAPLERWRKDAETEFQPPRKLALLCGHARSGTTLLEYVLDAHPQIVSADETSVFQAKAYPLLTRSRSTNESIVSALDWITPRNVRHIRAEYFRGIESFIGEPIGERLLLDKNPALFALRDPRDVCLSCFMQPAPILPDTVPWLTLEDTIKNYALVNDMWLALKPCLGNAAMEVRYEDLVEDLEANARRVLEFLGVGWDERVLRFHEHAASKTVRSPTYADVTKPIFKTAVGRWRHYEKYFAPHLEHLTPTLRALGYPS